MPYPFIMVWLITLLQTVKAFSLIPFLITIIARIMFTSKLIGANIKFKATLALECIALVFFLLTNLLFTSDINITRILIYSACSLGVVLFEYVDYALYLYIVEDERSKE